MGQEIKETIKNRKIDIMIMTETNQKSGQTNIRMTGYKQYEKGKKEKRKTGGGVAIMVHKNIPSNIWRNDEREELNEKYEEDIIWVKIQKNENKLAIGAVYMNAEGTKDEKQNEEKTRMLEEDIKRLQGENHEIIIIGDFNGHIQTQEGGGGRKTKQKTNRNGRRLLNMIKNTKLKILNGNYKVEGKWTWMRKTQKSEIDYIVTSESVENKLITGNIDDKGEIFTYNHDHSWIEVTVNINKEKSQYEKKGQVWKINKNTDWASYREGIEKELNSLKEELNKKETDLNASMLYDRMKEGMLKVEQTIGYTNGNKWKFENKIPAKLRRKRKRKNNK